MGNKTSTIASDKNYGGQSMTDPIGQVLASKCFNYKGNFELDRETYRKQR